MAFLTRLVLLAVAALIAACSDPHPASGAPPGGDFVLRSSGGPLDTRTQRGKVLLLYFGYTNCPDICPASLGNGAQALNRLSADERARVRLIMVSVDPERDTPERLREYTAYFHPEMIGLTGTAAEIAAVAKLYGAGYVRQPPRADGGYAVDHSSQTYVIDRDGGLAAVLDLGAPVDKVVETVRKLL